MPAMFRCWEPDQQLLPPQYMGEWPPGDLLARRVEGLVDAVDMTAFHIPNEWNGCRKRPHEPRMTAEILLQGGATVVFPSQALASKLEEDVAFRVPDEGNFPSHSMLRGFRRQHLDNFKRTFPVVAFPAHGMSPAGTGKFSVIGTKVRANARRKAAAGCRMRRMPFSKDEALQ